MSIPRLTEIMEQEVVTGWTAQLVEAEGAETVEVKGVPGKVAKIVVNTESITVTLKDGTSAIWADLTNTSGLDLVTTPIQMATSINLDFSGAGSAWILFK